MQLDYKQQYTGTQKAMIIPLYVLRLIHDYTLQFFVALVFLR